VRQGQHKRANKGNLKAGTNINAVISSITDTPQQCTNHLFDKCSDDDCNLNHELVDSLNLRSKKDLQQMAQNTNTSTSQNNSQLVVHSAQQIQLVEPSRLEKALERALEIERLLEKNERSDQ